MAEAKEIKTTEKKPKVEAKKDLATLQQELKNLMLDVRTGKQKDTSKVRVLKKQIARALTAQSLGLINN
jgi:ribosomal protein L29